MWLKMGLSGYVFCMGKTHKYTNVRRPIDRPSAKSGSCDNFKTIWSFLMKLGKWTDGKVEIMHILLFCSSTVNFGCYVNLKFLFH